MSNNKHVVLTIDNEKNNYYNKIVPYALRSDNQLRFKTPLPTKTSLTDNYALWGPNWIKLNDINQRTHTVIELKDKLEILIDDDIETIIEETPESVFTDEDRAMFMIYMRKLASPAVVSEIGPGLVMATLGHLWAKIRFINTATPTSKKAPRGNFVFFETYIGVIGLAPSEIHFENGNVSTSSSFHFTFTEAEVGKTCYVRCFYQIKNGDRSPSSIIISFQIN